MEQTQMTQAPPYPTDYAGPICDICTKFEEQGNPEADDVRHMPFPKLVKELALPKLAEFVAGAGLIQIEGELKPRKMSMETFAHMTGWSRKQLYRWMDSEENWNEQVYAAIRNVHSAKRVARVLSGLYVQAAQGSGAQAEMYLRHFWPDYKAPKEEKDITFTGLADLYKAHASSQDPLEAPIEGEVIEQNAIGSGN
jgi:hypothetical protein